MSLESMQHWHFQMVNGRGASDPSMNRFWRESLLCIANGVEKAT